MTIPHVFFLMWNLAGGKDMKIKEAGLFEMYKMKRRQEMRMIKIQYTHV